MFTDDIQNIHVKDFITFKYNGGSNPGSIRRVIVEYIDYKDYLEGYDVDSDGYRKYKIEKMESICKLWSSMQKIDVSQLKPKQIITFMHHSVRYTNGVTVVRNELHRGYVVFIDPVSFDSNIKSTVSIYDLDQKEYIQVPIKEIQNIRYHGMIYDPIKSPQVHRLKTHIQEQFHQVIDESIIEEILKFKE